MPPLPGGPDPFPFPFPGIVTVTPGEIEAKFETTEIQIHLLPDKLMRATIETAELSAQLMEGTI
tara:strand:+ start:344 stop:535 length:192 start_codon:yes stop_codon:yes gene_type:complete